MSFTRATVLLDGDQVRVVVNPAEIVDGIGSNILQSATITLTDAQIKALPTTGAVLIPATEVLNLSGFPTQLFHPIKTVVILDARAGAYGNITNGRLSLYWGSELDVLIGLSSKFSSGLLDATMLVPNAEKQQLEILNIADWCNDGLFLDNALMMSASNSGGFTDGHADNTMKVTVYYTVVDT